MHQKGSLESERWRGAESLLIDDSSARRAAALADDAARCRRLAGSIGDERTCATLRVLAEEYDGKAEALRAAKGHGRA